MSTKKKGRLSRAEIFYIQQNPHNLTTEEMAEELGRTVKAVENVKPAEPKPQEEEVKPTVQHTTVHDLMGRHERGATVMTPAAAEVSDATRSNRTQLKKELRNAIHKPRG